MEEEYITALPILQARILVQVIEENLQVLQAARAQSSPGPQRH
jgi:hypothetical protein